MESLEEQDLVQDTTEQELMYHMKEGVAMSGLSDLATQNLWLERVSWRQISHPWRPRMGYVSGVSDLDDTSSRYLCKRQGQLGRGLCCSIGLLARPQAAWERCSQP
jgi:hypothetical protein